MQNKLTQNTFENITEQAIKLTNGGNDTVDGRQGYDIAYLTNLSYSNVNYVRSGISVDIKCPKHDIFPQRPNDHLSGHGCKKCADELLSIVRKHSLSQVIRAFQSIHGDQYDYSKIIYKGSDKKVEIICPYHGVFRQTPEVHKAGAGCRDCGIEKAAALRTMPLSEFIERANNIHNNKYNYS